MGSKFLSYFRSVTMTCTLSQLFALSVGVIVCGSPTSSMKDLDKLSAVNFLVANRCHVKGSNYSIAQLVMNKLTPVLIDLEVLANLNICKNHIQNLTQLHKSVRQKQCSLATCSKPGERRVSFEQSCSAYLSQGWHILVGSSLCCSHRKLVTNSMTQAESEINQYPVGGSSGPSLHNSHVTRAVNVTQVTFTFQMLTWRCIVKG